MYVGQAYDNFEIFTCKEFTTRSPEDYTLCQFLSGLLVGLEVLALVIMISL